VALLQTSYTGKGEVVLGRR